jgi:hypothetical protein
VLLDRIELVTGLCVCAEKKDQACAECRAQFSVQGSSPFAKVAGKHLE